MKRILNNLENRTFDLLVVGGGIHGAVTAWLASMNGLSTALIEKGDFASGVSSNSQAIIHGGFRYLQKLDFPRIRQSLRARHELLRLAPFHVYPLASVIPLRGGIKYNPTISRIALLAYEAISLGRNAGLPRERWIPAGRILGRTEILGRLGVLSKNRVRGGLLWYDAFCISPERLVLDFIRAAVEKGAVAANYLAAESLNRKAGTVTGVIARDAVNNRKVTIRADKVALCLGPWTGSFLTAAGCVKHKGARPPLVLGTAVLVRKLFDVDWNVALSPPGTNRMYFAVPLHGRTLLGTEYFPFPLDDPEELQAPESVAMRSRQLLDKWNKAHPASELLPSDVIHVFEGVLPGVIGAKDRTALSDRFNCGSLESSGLKGLHFLEAVKLTTAIPVAEIYLKRIFPGRKWIPSSSWKPVAPGDREQETCGCSGFSVRSRVEQAIKEEMAMLPADILLRRTNWGIFKNIKLDELEIVLEVLSAKFAWSTEKMAKEKQVAMKLIRRSFPTEISFGK